MRRSELAMATRNVYRAFEDSGAFNFFLRVKPRPAAKTERPETGNGLDVFRSFISYINTFGPIELSILKTFDLGVATNTAFWVEALATSPDSARLRRFSSDLNQFRMFAPKILTFIETEGTRLRNEALKQPGGTQDVLTAILIEERGLSSKPGRIVDAIRSITFLYEVIATVRSLASDSLSIVGCDSGSDKSFDFLGLAEVMTALKALILELWDRAVFYRQARTEANLQVALRSLSIIDEIARIEAEQKLPFDECERLRRQATAAASMFLACGIVTPEIEQQTSHNPRALLAPQPKLLTGTASATEIHTTDVADASQRAGNGLTAGEEQLLRRLLEKARDADADGSDSEPGQ